MLADLLAYNGHIKQTFKHTHTHTESSPQSMQLTYLLPIKLESLPPAPHELSLTCPFPSQRPAFVDTDLLMFTLESYIG